MASIEKRGKNSWRLVVEVGYDSNGKRLKETKTIRIEDEQLLKTTKRLKDYLNSELMRFKHEIESGNYIKTDKMIFFDFCELWRDKFVFTELEVRTQDNYIYHLEKRILPAFKDMYIKDIKTMHIVDFLHNLKRIDGTNRDVGSATKVYVYRVLRSIFKTAESWRVIKDNPMVGVTKPKEVKSIELDVYDEKEVSDLFKALENERPMLRLLVGLALTTGMRRGEILGLEWKYINLEKGLIKIVQSIPTYINGVPLIKLPKTKGSIRTVSIPASMIYELEHYRKVWNKHKLKNLNKWYDNSEFLFCNKNGMPLYPKSLTDMWREFTKRKKIKHIRLHDLRHTSATLLINQGVHAKIIANRLGHSKIATTMDVYGHVIESADKKAAELFDTIIPSIGDGLGTKLI